MMSVPDMHTLKTQNTKKLGGCEVSTQLKDLCQNHISSIDFKNLNEHQD